MSEPTFPSSPVLENPAAVINDPAAIAAGQGQNTTAVDLTNGPGVLGGVNQVFTLTPTTAPTEVQQVVLTGSGNRLNVSGGAAEIAATQGGAIIESAPLLSATGQVLPDAPKNINLTVDTAAGGFNGAAINTTEVVQGNTPGAPPVSIASAAGNQTPTGGFAFYASGGTGNDNISGSSLSDFIRGGDGNDDLNAGGGNDLVRGGAGTDTIFLGLGNDTLYYTLDQIDGRIDTLLDFTRTGSNGIDVITVDRGITATITNGGASIVFAANGLTTTLNSTNGVLFTTSDIRFLG